MTNLFQKEQAAAEGDNGRQLKEQMANGSLNITISQEDLCALQSMCSDIVAETWACVARVTRSSELSGRLPQVCLKSLET